MKQIINTLLLSFLSVLTYSQVGFQVSPGKLFFHQSAGENGTQSVMVKNGGGSPVLVRCSFGDWHRDSLGNKIYVNPGTLPNSNSKYLKVIPEEFTIQPGEVRNVEVSMLLPQNKDTNVTNSMLFITQMDEKSLNEGKQKSQQAFMKFRMQMAIHVYNEPPQIQYKNIDIQKVWYQYSVDTLRGLNPQTNKPETTIRPKKEMRAWIENTGDLIAEGTVRFELTDKKTLKEFKLEAVPFNSLPGDRLIIAARMMADMPKGTYTVVTLVDIGLDQPLKVAESEINFE